MHNYENFWSATEDLKRFGPASRHTRRLVHNALRPLAPSSVLDVGCGDGYLLKEISERHPDIERLEGVDISKSVFEKSVSML